ncbi:MAG: YitT family protein [Faecalibacterium sp.]|jgi:uncharacterized membrane-anchored protein YitT (DUF2179 family)|nr:YitT family protein [Faecalibacterium sp.]
MENMLPARFSVKELAKDILFDCAGSILFALGYYTFADKGGFAPGGVTGIAMLIRHYSAVVPLGTLTLLLNVPILIFCLPVLGRKYLFKSLRTMLISTFFMDVVFVRLPVYDGSPLLAAVFTGICAGAGLAIIYMRGSTTGGSDFIIAAVKKKYPHLSFGQITLVLDGCVILAGWAVFGSIDAVLYGLIAVFASTIVMDKIIYGAGAGKLVIVVTDHGRAAAQAISDVVDRGATLAPAIGSYTGQQKQMLYCACSNNEVFRVRRAVYEADPGAIIMICEANEVFGEGFKKAAEN